MAAEEEPLYNQRNWRNCIQTGELCFATITTIAAKEHQAEKSVKVPFATTVSPLSHGVVIPVKPFDAISAGRPPKWKQRLGTRNWKKEKYCASACFRLHQTMAWYVIYSIKFEITHLKVLVCICAN